MLDRQVVKEFLEEMLEELNMKVPKNINFDELVETFCLYTEDDYYEWLKDNYTSFFGSTFSWDKVKEKIEERRRQK